jgi:hypothetical protein
MAAFPYLKSRVGSCVLVQRQLEKVRVAANEWELFGRVWFTGFSGLEDFLVASGKDGLLSLALP